LSRANLGESETKAAVRSFESGVPAFALDMGQVSVPSISAAWRAIR